MQQLIIYQIKASSEVAFHEIIRSHTRPTMIRLGFQVAGFWVAERRVGPADRDDAAVSEDSDVSEVAYLLNWRDRAAMDAGWEALNADPAHIAFVSNARKGERYVVNIQNRVLHPIDEIAG